LVVGTHAEYDRVDANQVSAHMIEPVVDSITHERALRRIEKLWDAEPGSREERELDTVATLVDAYERRAFPIESPRAGEP
jgi:antitoxin component HigA of HigAB toxin-antitoxin module